MSLLNPTLPALTFQNTLAMAVDVYDAFQSNEPNSEAYFGTLTKMATVPAGEAATVPPIHGPISTYLVYDQAGNPVCRWVAMGKTEQSFKAADSEVGTMKLAMAFVAAQIAAPQSATAAAFNKLLAGPSPATAVNAWFAADPTYKTCTFVDYMLAVMASARAPGATPAAPPQASYRLSTLCNLLGGSWPPGMPDISVSDFSCSDENQVLKLSGMVDIGTIALGGDAIAANVLSLLPERKVRVKASFNYGFGLGLFGIHLEFDLPKMTIPAGVTTISIDSPTIALDIQPLFKFAVFSVKATIPFALFDKTFDAGMSMTVDNLEAAIGMTVSAADGASLPAPPVMKGVHFDQFGAGMGVFFEPPGYALGVSGKFHIGEGANVVALDDDTFCVVCKLDGDIPEPVYAAFNVPRLDLSQLVAVFTDSKLAIDFPVSVSDLSFRWSENPMEPVVLPDGSLSAMGYGFSGNLSVFGIDFYGDVEVGGSGLQGTLALSPLALGSLFSLTGDGKAVTIKIDDTGNPIRNNQLATTAAMRKALDGAITRQLVAAGGPELTVSTSASPYFTLDAGVKLFDVVSEKVDAVIDNNGISFSLDAGTIVKSKLACVLKDFHNLSAAFTYGIDTSIPLPSIAGFSLGSIPLEALCDVELGIATSGAAITFSVGGGFDFEGLKFHLGPYSESLDISRLSDLIASIGRYLLDHAADIFSAIIGDAGKWASWVAKNLIHGVEDVAQGLKTAYNQTAAQVASILHDVGYGLDQAANALRHAFGGAASDVAGALSSAYGATAQGVATAMRDVGYGAEEVASALSSAFGAAPGAINDILQGAGYAADEVESAFNSLGGTFASFASETWQSATHALNPSNW